MDGNEPRFSFNNAGTGTAMIAIVLLCQRSPQVVSTIFTMFAPNYLIAAFDHALILGNSGIFEETNFANLDVVLCEMELNHLIRCIAMIAGATTSVVMATLVRNFKIFIVCTAIVCSQRKSTDINTKLSIM